MANKDKMFSMRIPEKLLEEYKIFCDENSFNISKRIRKFMERDIQIWKDKNIKKNTSQS